MDRNELREWCDRNGISPEQRNLGKNAPSKLDRDRAADNTAGAIVKAMKEAGVSDKIKMPKNEAIAKMQKGLTAYARREAQRTATTEHLLERSLDNLPQVELRDVDTSAEGVQPMILLPGGRGR